MTVPISPALSHIPGVELMHAGTWSASTGVHTFSREDFTSAVAAMECPAVRRPVLKLGHTDPRFDGEPAVGWIANMAAPDDGNMLVGDYVGMPGWLGPVIASAYPDRSIEGEWNHVCALGHTHPFVISAVALLGVTNPAIGTLESLQDVAALYGVVAASEAPADTRFAVHLKGSDMPNPRPPVVAMSVTTEDVRRAYYDDAPWSVWIEEIQLDPLQLIIIDDSTGTRSRVPVTVAGDGTDGVTFEESVPVVIRYEDVSAAPADAPAIAASAAQTIRYSNRAESRPGSAPRASTTPTDTSAAGNPKGDSAVALELTDEQETALRAALDLGADADAAAILTAVEELATAPDAAASTTSEGTPVAASAGVNLPDGLVAIDRDILASMQSRIAQGVQASERQEDDDRRNVVDEAVRLGKFPPAKRDHWLAYLKADPKGGRELIANLATGLVPVADTIGHANDAPESDLADTDLASLEASLGLPKGALSA